MDQISRSFCKESPLFTLTVKSIAFRLRQKQKETPLSGYRILLLDDWWTSIQKLRFTMPLAFSP